MAPRLMTEPMTTPPPNEHRMRCMELWGGVTETKTSVGMTGLDGYVFSRPFQGESRGGDVYYFTSCASGRISRVLLADVAGHGLVVTETAALLRSIMRRQVNVIGQSSLMSALNQEFSEVTTDGRFATALVATYFEPSNSLTLSIAGHPPPLIYRRKHQRWFVFGAEDDAKDPVGAGLPLGVLDTADYHPTTVSFSPGDRLLAYTDAFFESAGEHGQMLQSNGLLDLMNQAPPNGLNETVAWLVGQLEAIDAANLTEDDATAILLEPTGTGIPMRNNLMAPVRMMRGVQEIDSEAGRDD